MRGRADLLRMAVPAIAGLAVVASWTAVAAAQELRPFTQVNSVCPTCEPERFDTITLKQGGEPVRAWVLTENEDFYVLERFGELRAVGRDQVAEVKLTSLRKADERQALRARHQDQILIKNGHVVSGRVIAEDKQQLSLRSVCDRFTYVVTQERVRILVKGGKVVRRG